jgi:hypothetical protein
MQLSAVEANIGRDSTISDRDIRITVTVQVSYCRVPRGPFRIPIGSANLEMACAVVDQDQFGIRGIIAQYDVKMAALCHVGE